MRKWTKRWRIPARPYTELAAADGAALLDEDYLGLGVLLWDIARDAVLWATTPHAERAGLFHPAAERRRAAALFPVMMEGENSSFETALESLAHMVGSPERISAERVGLACCMLSRRADNRGAVATASVFAQAAALTCIANPRYSYEAGRMDRRRARYARAEMWLKRGILLGRQYEEWFWYGKSFLGLGNVYVHRGDYPRAKKYHLRSLRASRRHGLRDLEGDACHDLCAIAVEAERLNDLNTYARAAYQAFGEGNSRLPSLANDVAFGWMRQGYFACALEVFEAVRPRIRRDQYVLILGNICRAAAGTGDVERFESAWYETQEWIENEPAREYVAQVLLDLACGAALLKKWDSAERVARRSLELATARQEARVQLTAEAMLQSIRHEQATQIAVPHHSAETAEQVNALAADFVESMTACATAGA